MNITIWNEFHPSSKSGRVNKTYPDGIHAALNQIFENNSAYEVTMVTQDQPENGLTDPILNNTDVLIWWGHIWHDNVLTSVSDKVCKRILDGMGAIFLHASYASKPFIKLMGTSCKPKWRETDEKERLWAVDPSHPILSGIPETFLIEPETMVGEFFDIPTPDELILLGWFPGGEVIRAGCTFKRGRGKIFYFQPGHETCPTYYNQHVKQIILNATAWATPLSSVSVENYNTPQKDMPAEPVEVTKKSRLKSFFKR
ncbi:MAG: ThuA domain-containing protein [Christensenellaceae bacterium]|jgi:trehalose utilization protein|nr:ThuA domain-containing protein [Christensenellaceae bacterium]